MCTTCTTLTSLPRHEPPAFGAATSAGWRGYPGGGKMAVATLPLWRQRVAGEIALSPATLPRWFSFVISSCE